MRPMLWLCTVAIICKVLENEAGVFSDTLVTTYET
jgi:hypothetical protein